jgi:hypothetical protein
VSVPVTAQPARFSSRLVLVSVQTTIIGVALSLRWHRLTGGGVPDLAGVICKSGHPPVHDQN